MSAGDDPLAQLGVSDANWSVADMRELVEKVRGSEVGTAPASYQHTMWAKVGKTLSTPRTAHEARMKYNQVRAALSSGSGAEASSSDDPATGMGFTPFDCTKVDATPTTGAVNAANARIGRASDAGAKAEGEGVLKNDEKSASAAAASDKNGDSSSSTATTTSRDGDVLDKAIAESELDDSQPRKLAFASPAPVLKKNTAFVDSPTNSSADSTTSSAVATAAKSDSTSSAKKKKKKLTSLRGIHVGATVMVDSRTWPGMNKPGGAGRVTSITDNGMFNIKYLLGGSERNVNPDYVHCRNLTAAQGERKRRRRTYYDPINNEAVVPDADGIVQSEAAKEEEKRAALARERAAKEAMAAAAAAKKAAAKRAAATAAKLKADRIAKAKAKAAAKAERMAKLKAARLAKAKAKEEAQKARASSKKSVAGGNQSQRERGSSSSTKGKSKGTKAGKNKGSSGKAKAKRDRNKERETSDSDSSEDGEEDSESDNEKNSSHIKGSSKRKRSSGKPSSKKKSRSRPASEGRVSASSSRQRPRPRATSSTDDMSDQPSWGGSSPSVAALVTMGSTTGLASAVDQRIRQVVVKPPHIYVNHPSDFKPEPFCPRMEWPLPPKWMDETSPATLDARPTLFQGAQYIATTKSRRHERRAWVASVLSRESPPRKKN